MRLLLLTVVLVCTGLALPALGQATGPSLQIENISRDAGTVSQGDVIRQVFAFSNKGSGLLQILNVEHS